MDMDPHTSEMLQKYAFSGIGSILNSILAPWVAQQNVKVMKITAQGEADKMKIIGQGGADAINTFLSQLDPSVQIKEGNLILDENMRFSVLFQVQKRQNNIKSVLHKAAIQLGDKKVPDHEPDHDWTSDFFNHIQDVSDEEMQILWGKVLAGEVERKGGTSRRTLRVLSLLDKEICELFRRFCSMCFFVIQYPDGKIIDARLPGAIDREKFIIYDYDACHHLNEFELIRPAREEVGRKPDETSYDYTHCAGIKVNSSQPKIRGLTITLADKDLPCIVRIPFSISRKVLDSSSME